MTKLYLAIPCYNEEEVLRDSTKFLIIRALRLFLATMISDL